MTKDPKRLEALAVQLGTSTEEAASRISKVKNKFGNMTGDDILDLLEQWESLSERPIVKP